MKDRLAERLLSPEAVAQTAQIKGD